MDQTATVPAWITRRALDDPDHEFIVEVDGRRVSYAEFHDECLTWASAFQAVGVREGDRVVTMLPPSIDGFACWIGLAWLKAIDVGANTDYQGRMLAYLLNNSGAQIIVTLERWFDRLVGVADQLNELRTVVLLDATNTPAGASWLVLTRADLLSGHKPLAGLDPPRVWDDAMVIYTSGTTGPSKGVLISWGQQVATTFGVIPADSVGEDDVFYSPFPMFHGSGRIGLSLMAHANGRLVLREKFSGEHFWTDIKNHGCTTTCLVGPMSAWLLNQPPKPDDANNPLRRVIMLPVVPQYREFAHRFGVKIRTTYAMTEIVPVFGTDWTIEDPASCGKALPGVQVRLVDEHDFEVPDGQTGELVLRTERPWTLCNGYLGLPDKVAEAWRNGWFHTGDAFRRDSNGNYFFVDRIKDAIRRRGENISSFEVEFAVNEHPEVAECAAVAVPYEWGEDEIKIVVVRTPGSTLTPEELIDYLVPRLPRFMVPRYVEFTESLPKTEATMRIRKVELRQAGITATTWDREAGRNELRRGGHHVTNV